MQGTNHYQVDIWELQKQIFDCNLCHGQFPPRFLGPDSIFVGKEYGLDISIPKILFIGINPNSNAGDFGTRRNTIKIYGLHYRQRVSPTRYYKDYFNGVKIIKAQRLHRFGGFIKFNIYSNSWAIKRVLIDLFDIPHIAENFAMTNAIQCTGPRKRGLPTKVMKENCIQQQQWLRQTIELLEPDIIFIFSVGSTTDSTWQLFTLENHLVAEECYLKPPVDWCYRPKINIGTRQIQPLTFAVPHFAIPNFCAKTFDGIRDSVHQNGDDIWANYLELIKSQIRKYTSFGIHVKS